MTLTLDLRTAFVWVAIINSGMLLLNYGIEF